MRARVRVRGGLPRAPRPLPLPAVRRAAAGSRRGGARRAAERHARRLLHAAIAAATRARPHAPLPGLYNVYNAGAAALCHALGVPFERIVAGLEAVEAAFGRAETIALDGPRAVDPAHQEPRRRERGAAHARVERTARSTCSRCSTTTSPTGATSRGCGTPTSSCSPAACGASRARARAPASWPYGSSTPAWSPSGSSSCPSWSRAGRGAGGRPPVPLRAADLHRAAGAARAARAPRRRAGVLAMTRHRRAARALARPRVRPLRGGPAAVA